MNFPPKHLALAFTAVLLTGATAQADVTFQWLDDAYGIGDMSPDGRYIVGQTDLNDDFFPDGTYLYDRETDTMTILPPEALLAAAVSDDGRVVVGEMPDPADPDPVMGVVACMWTADTNEWVSLGYLPNALECPSRSDSYEISADGSMVVGLSWDGCSGRGFLWTEATGMLELDAMDNGGCRASVISGDGTLIAGFCQGMFSRTPTMWDGTTLDGEYLGPADGSAEGEVRGISDDGSIMLGSFYLEGETTGGWFRAYKWTDDGEGGYTREQLGAGSIIPGWGSGGLDIADDEGTIVGFDYLVGNRRAWIQPQGSGDLIFLGDYIEDNGGILPTIPVTPRIEVAYRISRDGTVIAGHDAFDGAWIVEISICPWDTAGEGGSQLPDGTVGVADFFDLLQNWGPNCPQPFCIWDTTGPDGEPDGEVGVEDFFALLQNWGPCPGT